MDAAVALRPLLDSLLGARADVAVRFWDGSHHAPGVPLRRAGTVLA